MRTKIIATIGPNSETKEMIEKMIAGGMDMARMNFSHCTEKEYVSRIKFIRAAEKKTKKKIQIMQDLQGPRIRVGELPQSGIELVKDRLITFSTKKGDNGAVFVDYPKLHKDVCRGEIFYLANGEMELVVEKVSGQKIIAKVVRGGVLYSRKGLNFPVTKLSNSGLTSKDVRDVKCALRHGVDWIAMSFVQSADDVRKLKRIVKNRAKVIAKIETAVALKNIDSIIQESDAIMVARGDLGIEVPLEKVPMIQKNLIRHANWHGKGAIIATQMLMSMVNHPRPTRAEVSDVANAVWDGADGVMMSEETAKGEYPLKALRMMVRIVSEAEKFHLDRPNPLLEV